MKPIVVSTSLEGNWGLLLGAVRPLVPAHGPRHASVGVAAAARHFTTNGRASTDNSRGGGARLNRPAANAVVSSKTATRPAVPGRPATHRRGAGTAVTWAMRRGRRPWGLVLVGAARLGACRGSVAPSQPVAPSPGRALAPYRKYGGESHKGAPPITRQMRVK